MQSTRRGSFSVHRSEKTPGSKYSSTSGLSPRGHLERQAEFHASTQDEAGLSCDQCAGNLRSESEIRGTLRFLPQLEMRPSSNAPNSVESREAPPNSSFPNFAEPYESPPRSPAQVEGSQGFLPQPEKDLERPSSTRLEATFPYQDSRAMTRSPSPLARSEEHTSE